MVTTPTVKRATRTIRRMIIVACTLAATVSGCSRDGDRHLPMPSPAADAAVPRERASYDAAGLGSRIAALDAPNSSEETKIGVLEALANDRGDGATSVLLRFVDDPSTLISAASIKGLARRGCQRVEPVLVRLLDDPEWQRRAWAAKVLGSNGCRSAAPALGDRSKREDDDRVTARLKEAMQLLQEVGR